MQLCAAAGQHHTIAEDIACQFRRGLFQHLMGGSADLLTQHHHRLVEVAGGNIHLDGQAGQQAAALHLHRLVKISLLGAAGDILFQLLCGTLADGNAELVADMFQDLVIIVVARHTDTGGLDLAAQRQDSDIGGAAADINDHPAIGLGDVDAGTQCSGNGLIDQVDLTGTGGHHGLHHGITLNAGDGSGHADSHPGLDHVGAVHLIHKPADQLPGHGVVADDTVLQRENGGNIVGGAAYHGQGLVAHLQHGVLAGIHCHHAGLVEHDPLPCLCNDNGRCAQIDADVILCHNETFLSLLPCFLS